MEEVLYHFSHQGGLKELRPHKSSHGKEYVYATWSKELGLLFASNKDHGDFDATYGINQDKIPFYKEGYKDALKECFSGVDGYCYTVPADTFEHKTSFSGELVSETAVPVLKSEYIPDLYDAIMSAEKSGKIIITLFDEHNDQFNAQFREKLRRMITDCHLPEHKESQLYSFVQRKYPDILEELERHKV